MHYKDGTEAKVGDVVKGMGYNVRDKARNLKVFVGTVVGVCPGMNTCNIRVLHHRMLEPVEVELTHMVKPADNHYFYRHDYTDKKVQVVVTEVEYGQCDHFELVHRPVN